MDKKYELTDEFVKIYGKKLFRIKALKSFKDVKAGDLGGYIEKYENLSQDGDAWVYENAKVFSNALIFDNVEVYGNARVFGIAKVYDNAMVYGNAKVFGNTWVFNNAKVYGNAKVRGDAEVCGNAEVRSEHDYATIKGFGTFNRNTTFFRCKDNNVRVSCGCFYGTIPEFRGQVKNTRTGKVAEEYLMIADLMEKHFNTN